MKDIELCLLPEGADGLPPGGGILDGVDFFDFGLYTRGSDG
jgi:hypothetical protein